MIRLESGYHPDLPMSVYLADPAPEPSLSTRTVCDLVDTTPLHARENHPRLENRPGDFSPRADLGSAIHSRILGGYEVVYCGEVEKLSGKNKGERFIPDDWATNAAKEFRDTARGSNQIPLLEHQRECVEKASANAIDLLHGVSLTWKSSVETSMLWQAHNVWMRGRADVLTELYDIDVKTVDSADGFRFGRTIMANGYDVQAGLRLLGHQTLAQPREMLWLLVEIKPPYACSLVGMGETLRELALRKITHAAAKWRTCLDSGKWPGYAPLPVWAEATSFQVLELDARGVKQ